MQKILIFYVAVLVLEGVAKERKSFVEIQSQETGTDAGGVGQLADETWKLKGRQMDTSKQLKRKA